MLSKMMCKTQNEGDRLRAILSLRTAALVVVSLLVALFSMQTGSASSPGDETYVFVSAWDNMPPPETFNSPCGVAVGSIGNVYVVDTNNHRIQKFTSNGDFITQ